MSFVEVNTSFNAHVVKQRAVKHLNEVDGFGFRVGRWYQKGRAHRLYLGVSSDGLFILYERRADISRQIINGVQLSEGVEWFDRATLVK